MTVFGTRPDAIKMAPVVLEFLRFPKLVKLKVVVTGQHREMLDQVLEVFGIVPDIDLNLMQHGQTLAQISSRSLNGLDKAIKEFEPDIVLAQGDTTTTFISSLAAFFHKIPFGHVEAGLRTDDKYDPFPEEMNRRLTGQITEFHFAPTALAKENLLREGVKPDRIWVTGNTGIDAMLHVAANTENVFQSDKRMILVTTHRRENWGEPIRDICLALSELLERFPDIEIIYSLHKNPAVRETIRSVLEGKERVQLIEPPDYAPFAQLMRQSYLILTDSGGIQEEAPSLGKPVLVLRKTTERPEGITAGTSKLIGTATETVIRETSELLLDSAAYSKMAKAANPYGDGQAAKRIRCALFEVFGISNESAFVET